MGASLALFLLATGSVLAAVVDQRAACKADNCYRAVYKPSSLSMRSTDCSSFLAPTTVTLSAVTVTVTTYSVYSTPPATSTGVPAYASPCSGSVRYSSACSCIGVTQATITVTPTSSPATATVTSTIVACDPANNYGFNYNGVSYNPPSGTQQNSSYGPDHFFSSTLAECCAACYTTVGCMLADYSSNNLCTLFVYDGSTPTNPYNQICPWGIGGFGGGSGFSIAPGPCANPV